MEILPNKKELIEMQEDVFEVMGMFQINVTLLKNLFFIIMFTAAASLRVIYC